MFLSCDEPPKISPIILAAQGAGGELNIVLSQVRYCHRGTVVRRAGKGEESKLTGGREKVVTAPRINRSSLSNQVSRGKWSLEGVRVTAHESCGQGNRVKSVRTFL